MAVRSKNVQGWWEAHEAIRPAISRISTDNVLPVLKDGSLYRPGTMLNDDAAVIAALNLIPLE